MGQPPERRAKSGPGSCRSRALSFPPGASLLVLPQMLLPTRRFVADEKEAWELSHLHF